MIRLLVEPAWFLRVAVVAVCASLFVPVTSFGASATDAGSLEEPAVVGAVTVVQPANQNRLLSGGTETTLFSLRLPADAACPGDSRNDDWRIQSFIIPANDDPLDLEYGLVSPEGQDRYPLFMADTTTYMQVFLRPNDGPGKPGVIEPVPPLSFSALESGTVATGSYRIGLACTYFRQTARVWDALVDLEIEPNGSAGFAWSVPRNDAAVADSNGGSSTSLAAVVVAIGVVISAVLVLRSRTHSKRSKHDPTH